jgi:hypothetical protein
MEENNYFLIGEIGAQLALISQIKELLDFVSELRYWAVVSGTWVSGHAAVLRNLGSNQGL